MKDFLNENIDIMNELQLNQRNNLIFVLEYIASTEKSKAYQLQVPFTILGEELYQQWNSIFYAKNKKWFQLTFNEIEKDRILKFDKMFNGFYTSGNDEVIKDTNVLLTNKDWKMIQLEAQHILALFKNG